MKDIYRRMMIEAFKDVQHVVAVMEEEYEMEIPDSSIPQMGIVLYNHRIEQKRYEHRQGKENEFYPEETKRGQY